MGFPQARILDWVAISSPGNLPDPGVEPKCSALVGTFFTVGKIFLYFCSPKFSQYMAHRFQLSYFQGFHKTAYIILLFHGFLTFLQTFVFKNFQTYTKFERIIWLISIHTLCKYTVICCHRYLNYFSPSLWIMYIFAQSYESKWVEIDSLFLEMSACVL